MKRKRCRGKYTLKPKPSIIVWIHPKEKKLLRQRIKSRMTNGGATETVITGTGGGLTSVMKVFLAASEGERRTERWSLATESCRGSITQHQCCPVSPWQIPPRGATLCNNNRDTQLEEQTDSKVITVILAILLILIRQQADSHRSLLSLMNINNHKMVKY